MTMNRPPPSDNLHSGMGSLFKRATAWLSQVVPSGSDKVDRHARDIVYSMLTQYLTQSLPRSENVSERELLPALAGLLGESNTSHSPRTQVIQKSLRKILLQIHVSYKRVRSDDDKGKRHFVVECSAVVTIADKAAKTLLSRSVTWEEMPNVVTEHFIRSAEEIEMRLYPLEGGE
jgi:hypothetical protein